MVDQPVDATRRADNSNKRALVLAGGGAAGNAWEIGLIAGRQTQFAGDRKTAGGGHAR